jgi:predicted GH43/DUF377 family glycosyl hydrolase
MSSAGEVPVVRRTEHLLRADPTRLVARLFLPGDEQVRLGVSRTAAVVERVLALTDAEVEATLRETMESFAPRHHDLRTTLESHFSVVAGETADPSGVPVARRLLIGACMTQEYAIESAALFNPSMVAHPDQSGLAPGEARFVMSVRGVGEGHISCIELRTGTIDARGKVEIDVPGTTTSLPGTVAPRHSRVAFERNNAELPGEGFGAMALLATLPAEFGAAELEAALDRHAVGLGGAADGEATAERIRHIATFDYTVAFDPQTRIDSRVILPRSPAESHGMEDVRLVRFVDDDGSARYLGTYTAFDGVRIAPHLLRTEDFVTFEVGRLSGTAARNKGMALFPRAVHGQYLALSRWDRENNALATSADLLHWMDAGTLAGPRRPWGIIQTGNCGPPVETSEGWLVLTHGVGPMRRYCIGAMLLDLDDPRKVLAGLDEPLLAPLEDEREGYVPNVVYSCGAMLHGDTMVLPYGASDSTVRIALVDVPGLLGRLRSA